MKETMDEGKPAEVVREPTQAGETQSRWNWVKRTVWTERMLTALETGVKGGKWFSLMDKVYGERNLREAWEDVKRRKGSGGVDGQRISEFEKGAERRIQDLSKELCEGRYNPMPVKRTYIPKAGSNEKRPLGIPAIRDRVVQTALRYTLEPIFERKFAHCSYGFRPGRGCKDALRQVQKLLDAGYAWVVDADIEKYFDTIPHEPLMKEVEEEIADGRVLELIRKYLKQGIMEGAEGWTPEEGTPQGAVISPLLANIYLHPIDVEMEKCGYNVVRYADDLVILCKSKEEAASALEKIKELMETRGLKLHPTKTNIIDATQPGGFEFLGYHFERNYRWPRKKSTKKLRDAIRIKTKRTNGNSLKTIIENVNQTLRGWFEYFKHSHKTTFPHLDSWIRMRLRSILRKRLKKKGRGRGSDHQRWPNAFFREKGLFTMTEAHMLLCQSRYRVC